MGGLGGWLASAALIVAALAVWRAWLLHRRIAATEAEMRRLITLGPRADIVGGLRAALGNAAQRERALDAENRLAAHDPRRAR